MYDDIIDEGNIVFFNSFGIENKKISFGFICINGHCQASSEHDKGANVFANKMTNLCNLSISMPNQSSMLS